ncbi:hypothetical protein ACWC0C_07115 [Streptomyces sp. NPDC001709]
MSSPGVLNVAAIWRTTALAWTIRIGTQTVGTLSVTDGGAVEIDHRPGTDPYRWKAGSGAAFVLAAVQGPGVLSLTHGAK